MPDPDPTRTDADAASGDLEEDPVDESDAWEALAEDRQRQLADSPASPTTELPTDTPETVSVAPAPPRCFMPSAIRRFASGRVFDASIAPSRLATDTSPKPSNDSRSSARR